MSEPTARELGEEVSIFLDPRAHRRVQVDGPRRRGPAWSPAWEHVTDGCRACAGEAALAALVARCEQAERACNICGVEWPEHHPSCAYVGNVRDKLLAEARVSELEALLIEHHAVGVMDGALAGDTCPVCAKEETRESPA